MDRLTSAGVSQGLVLLGNCTKFEILPAAETKDLVSRKRDTAGQTLASVTKAQPTTISLTLNEYDKDIMAVAFLGTVATQTGAGASVTDEVLVAIHDKYAYLDHRAVSSVVVTNTGGGTTYTVDVDYVVNARLGWIKVLSTGSIGDGDSLKVDYTWAAEDGYTVSGATEPIVKCRFLLDGKNDVNGKKCIVDVYEANVKPSSPIDFLKDDYAELELEGTLVTPTGLSLPFDIDYHE
jgi:hypothetical protein